MNLLARQSQNGTPYDKLSLSQAYEKNIAIEALRQFSSFQVQKGHRSQTLRNARKTNYSTKRLDFYCIRVNYKRNSLASSLCSFSKTFFCTAEGGRFFHLVFFSKLHGQKLVSSIIVHEKFSQKNRLVRSRTNLTLSLQSLILSCLEFFENFTDKLNPTPSNLSVQFFGGF